MKSHIAKFAGLASLLALTLVAGQAQSLDVLRIQAPFDFVAGGMRLPAGSYAISETSDPGVFLITGKISALVVTMPLGPEPEQAGATFSVRNGERYLSSLQIPGSPSRCLRIPPEHKLP
jgi:hypothetical protein